MESALKVKSNLTTIISEGVRLTDFINDLLDIAKIEEEEVEWKMEPASIAGIIELEVEISSSSFQWRGLELECDV